MMTLGSQSSFKARGVTFGSVINAVTASVVLFSCHSQIKATVVSGPSSSSSAVSLLSMTPVAVKPGETVTVSGKNFSKDTVIVVNGVSLKLNVLSSTSATFVAPAVSHPGAFTLAVGDSKNPTGGSVSTGAKHLVLSTENDGIPIFMATPAEICSGTTFRDATGTTQLGTKPCQPVAACVSDGEVNCVTSVSYKAADMAQVVAGNIKSGITIAGVTGQYPSAVYTLSGASGTSDLTAATFISQIKSNTAFEYWDSAGVRQQSNGDSDIAVNNIVSGVNIFGEVGTITSPDPWDLRVGRTAVTPAGSITGKLKINCRNTANLTLSDFVFPEIPMTAPSSGSPNWTITDSSTLSIGDQVRLFAAAPPGGFANGNSYYVVSVAGSVVTLSATSGGADITASANGSGSSFLVKMGGGSVDIWDTIDDLNNGVANLPPSVPSSWSANNQCGGYSTVATDDSVWLDVTTTGDGVTSSTCASTSAHCVYKDKISGLEFSKEAAASKTWPEAVTYCQNLVLNGKSDWRLPTQKELMSAYEHGIYAAYQAIYIYSNSFWSSTRVSNATNTSWAVALNNGYTFAFNSAQGGSVICVRN